MKSDFPAARRHLEEAFRLTAGDDELSVKTRAALDILIDAFLKAEFTAEKPADNVVAFDKRRHSAR